MIDTATCASLLADHPGARRWVIAYSGGMDSHVLLSLCARLARERDGLPPLLALHVDHGVHPRAREWSQHCAAVCAALGVRFEQRLADPGAGTPSEARLRRARYRVFEAFCEPGDLLLLAHHLDDQAETVMLRLIRGAGTAGLAGMPAERPCGAATLVRPLLAHPRSALHEWAQRHALGWVEDPSNEGQFYARNYLRHRVMPLLEQRWPGAATRIARAAEHCAEASAITTERADQDLLVCLRTDRFGQSFLEIEAASTLGAARMRSLLRTWLRRHGVEATESRELLTLQREVIEAASDRQPRLVLGSAVVRRHDGGLYLIARRAGRPQAPERFEIEPGYERRTAGAGRLALLPDRSGAGVRAGSRYEIAFRQAGLECRLAGRPAKPLKQVLQEARVPPWLRDAVPLLFVDGELAAVGGIGVCEGFVAEVGVAAVSLVWAPAADTLPLLTAGGDELTED